MCVCVCVWGPMERKRAETSMEVRGGVAFFFFCVRDSSIYELPFDLRLLFRGDVVVLVVERGSEGSFISYLAG